MRNSHEIIKRMLRTEKGAGQLVQNKYFFRVDRAANKVEIRSAVEEIYKVQVKSVNVINVRGKKKRVRYHEGMTSAWRKAIVTLKPNNKIEVT
jgi:large subunit ribosomal protein L23